MVANMISREVTIKLEQKEKFEALKKRQRSGGMGGVGDAEDDEIAQLEEKLKSLELPEETKKICDTELKKLR